LSDYDRVQSKLQQLKLQLETEISENEIRHAARDLELKQVHKVCAAMNAKVQEINKNFRQCSHSTVAEAVPSSGLL
jgi:hypothetical protein